MAQEVIEVTQREVEIIEVIERGPAGPQGSQPDINYTIVSSSQTVSSRQLIAADTSGGSFTLTLPVNPTAGDAVDIFDYSETFDAFPLTIARNGQPIESLNEDLICNVEGAYFTLIYTGPTRGWQVLPRYGVSGVSVVNGVAPIVSSGGSNPSVSISPATISSAGSMSAADKTKLDGISPSSSLPSQLGTASAGSSSNYSREDHVHPSEIANDFEITNPSKGIILRNGNGHRWRITIDNDGILTSDKL